MDKQRLQELAGMQLNEERNYDVPVERSIQMASKDFEKFIGRVDHIRKKAKREGNKATAASLSNIQGGMQQMQSLWEAALADLGK